MPVLCGEFALPGAGSPDGLKSAGALAGLVLGTITEAVKFIAGSLPQELPGPHDSITYKLRMLVPFYVFNYAVVSKPKPMGKHCSVFQ